MSSIRVGTAGFVVPRERYLSRLRFVEIDLRAPVPPPKTLAAWRRAAPEGFVFSAVAPESLFGERDWPLRDAAKTRSELDRFGNQLQALGARIAVLRSPLGVSPGSVAFERFRPVLERARALAPTLVWEPSGLWDHEEAVRVAEQFGAVVSGDPLQDEPGAAFAYARMRGLGTDQRYTMGRLEALAEALVDVDEAFGVVQSQQAWREAVGFAKLVGEIEASGDDEELDDDDVDGSDDDDEEEDDEDGSE